MDFPHLMTAAGGQKLGEAGELDHCTLVQRRIRTFSWKSNAIELQGRGRDMGSLPQPQIERETFGPRTTARRFTEALHGPMLLAGINKACFGGQCDCLDSV